MGEAGNELLNVERTRVKYRRYALALVVAIVMLSLHLKDCSADTASIKGTMKMHRMGGYIISVNYETRDRWTDNIVIKVDCEFNEANFIFTSNVINNIERGWHKTDISISKVMRKRYGSLRKYAVELYRNGRLVDKRESH